jgi:hypothetical protein
MHTSTRARAHTHTHSLSLSLSLSIYIYIYGLLHSDVIVSAGWISTDSILTSSDHELRKLGNLTKEECELVRTSVAKSLLPFGFIPGKIINQIMF